jgi:chromosome segregation ATPase
MTEQELLQENEKLNARLAKATAVFKQQKADIQRLTEERDMTATSISKLNERVSELEEQIKVNEEQDSNFFDQLQEIDTLKQRVSELVTSLEKTQTQYTNLDNEHKILENRYEDETNNLKADLQGTIQTLEDVKCEFEKYKSNASKIAAAMQKLIESTE